MRIAIEFSTYNERRYSRPWIFLVEKWETGKLPAGHFGNFTGRPGQNGDAEIEAKPGDIIRWGQKDYRNGKYTESNWGIVNYDGTVTEIPQKQARTIFLKGERENGH